jgi:hypothetical protein
MNSLQEQLFKLQTEQLNHDELFHKEITRLTIHQRLNHMALHFAKYSGKICNCILNSLDEQILRKTIIDSFIISITCANILNLRISDKLIDSGEQEYSSLVDLGHNIAKRLGVNTQDPLWLVKTFPVAAGEFAKGCESVDHLELYKYRESITDSVERICLLMIVAASSLNIDLVSEVPLRLNDVKKKSIFFDYYMSR